MNTVMLLASILAPVVIACVATYGLLRLHERVADRWFGDDADGYELDPADDPADDDEPKPFAELWGHLAEEAGSFPLPDGVTVSISLTRFEGGMSPKGAVMMSRAAGGDRTTTAVMPFCFCDACLSGTNNHEKFGEGLAATLAKLESEAGRPIVPIPPEQLDRAADN